MSDLLKRLTADEMATIARARLHGGQQEGTISHGLLQIIERLCGTADNRIERTVYGENSGIVFDLPADLSDEDRSRMIDNFHEATREQGFVLLAGKVSFK